jgi:hypothetical protein
MRSEEWEEAIFRAMSWGDLYGAMKAFLGGLVGVWFCIGC